MKLVTFLALFIILLALFWGLFGLLRPAPHSLRTVRALTVRISVAILLFLLLCAGMYLGWWTPHQL